MKLNIEFQKLPITERSKAYHKIEQMFATLNPYTYPNIHTQCKGSNEMKASIIVSLINMKTESTLSWDECFNTIEQNL